jgi:hypothetical protein
MLLDPNTDTENQAGFQIRIGSGFNQVSGFGSGYGSRREKNDPLK